MTRFLPFLLVLLCGCASSPTTYRQGAPGFAPVAPAPAYAPPGAGAPMVGQPGQQGAPEVPRSPHKRVLPATKEPGLWASDSSAASNLPAVPRIVGVDLPFPPGATKDEEKYIARTCGQEMSRVVQGLRTLNKWDVTGLSLEERRCIAARLYEHCASGRRTLFEQAIDSDRAAAVDKEVLLVMEVAVKSTDRTAKKFVETACASVQKAEDVENYLTHAMMAWDHANGVIR